jgi:ceramide glucosyltransferase
MSQGHEEVGINPKINNLVKSYRQAKFDLLWVIDSNALTSETALYNMVCEFQQPTYTSKRVGMVHHVPFPIYPDTFWGSRLEQAFLGSTHAKMYLAINACQLDSCIMGKSTMWRKSDLEQTTPGQQGGLEGYSSYLGEDNMIGRHIWHDLGMRHAMNPDVVGNTVGTMTLKAFFWRRVRWIRVRKYMVLYVAFGFGCSC